MFDSALTLFGIFFGGAKLDKRTVNIVSKMYSVLTYWTVI